MKRIIAALSFFTRLPFWRMTNLEKEHYEHVVPLWPLAGWLTGGVMAVVYWAATIVFTPSIAIIAALISRILITGALHEDGFADFCDGFGGGTTRERILTIMKDSHIGTYGVLGLILYLALIGSLLHGIQANMQSTMAAKWITQSMMAIFIIADTFCKWAASTIIYRLPYARREADAKSKLVYTKASITEKVVSILLGVLPACMLASYGGLSLTTLLPACCASFITAQLLFIYMNRRIGGYTGDCCGATFIITETMFYLILTALI